MAVGCFVFLAPSSCLGAGVGIGRLVFLRRMVTRCDFSGGFVALKVLSVFGAEVKGYSGANESSRNGVSVMIGLIVTMTVAGDVAKEIGTNSCFLSSDPVLLLTTYLASSQSFQRELTGTQLRALFPHTWPYGHAGMERG